MLMDAVQGEVREPEEEIQLLVYTLQMELPLIIMCMEEEKGDPEAAEEPKAGKLDGFTMEVQEVLMVETAVLAEAETAAVPALAVPEHQTQDQEAEAAG